MSWLLEEEAKKCNNRVDHEVDTWIIDNNLICVLPFYQTCKFNDNSVALIVCIYDCLKLATADGKMKWQQDTHMILIFSYDVDLFIDFHAIRYVYK